MAITSSVHPDPNTHIEPVTYGEGADSQSLLFALMTEAGHRGNQPLHLLANMARHPVAALRAARIRGWSRRTMVLLVMQSLDNAMRLKVKRRWPNGNVVLTTEQDPDNPNPDKIPAAYRVAEWIQQRIGGTAQSVVMEAALAIPTTAHILGGAVIGRDPIQRRDRRAPPRLWLPEPAGVRRLRGPRQHRREPEPNDHRPHRARDRRDPDQRSTRDRGRLSRPAPDPSRPTAPAGVGVWSLRTVPHAKVRLPGLAAPDACLTGRSNGTIPFHPRGSTRRRSASATKGLSGSGQRRIP